MSARLTSQHRSLWEEHMFNSPILSSDYRCKELPVFGCWWLELWLVLQAFCICCNVRLCHFWCNPWVWLKKAENVRLLRNRAALFYKLPFIWSMAVCLDRPTPQISEFSARANTLIFDSRESTWFVLFRVRNWGYSYRRWDFAVWEVLQIHSWRVLYKDFTRWFAVYSSYWSDRRGMMPLDWK
jgi:hypothetical protein